MKKLDCTITEHIKKLQEMKTQVFCYYLTDSKLWHAIQNHVCQNECTLIDHPEKHLLRYYRGTGPAIMFDNAIVHENSENYSLYFYVVYVPEDQKYYDDPESVRKSFSLQVPIDLEVNFTEEKFKKWVKEVSAKNIEKKEAEATEQLRKLKKKFPSIYKTILNERKR